MKKRLLLHIGTGKTGSSTIQSYLRRRLKTLQSQGIDYPLPPSWSNQGIVTAMFREDTALSRGLKSEIYRLESSISNIRRDVDRSLRDSIKIFDNVIVSTEFFCQFSAIEVSRVREYFNSIGFDEFLVVCFFREPISYYTSWVQQHIKASSTFIPPREFNPRYKEIERAWRGSFSSDFLVTPFDPAGLRDPFVEALRIIGDFFDADLPYDPAGDRPTNASISAEGMEVVRQHRQIIYPYQDNIPNPNTQKLISSIQRIENQNNINLSRPEIRDVYKLQILNHCRSDIEHIINNNYFDSSLFALSAKASPKVHPTDPKKFPT